MKDTFLAQYSTYLREVEASLSSYCQGFSKKNQTLSESMAYSLMLGGKRIRPVIVLGVADVLGISHDEVMPYAISLEMIHTHSLIHDDLPALDNDDYRRGKPSNHKVYGEAMAILAGDALLNHAYGILFTEAEKGINYAKAAKYLCDCTGDDGMLAGQANDIEAEGSKVISEERLLAVYSNKTGKLLEAPFVIPAILSQSKKEAELKKLGDLVGLLFQLTDDILDVEGSFSSMGKTLGKDQEEGKLTAISVYGLEESKRKAKETKEQAKSLCKEQLKSPFLEGLIDYIFERNN